MVAQDIDSKQKAGVHSVDHYALDVPDFETAKRFYQDFGLDVQEIDHGLALRTFNDPHVWVYLYAGEKKRLNKIAFGAFAEDMARLRAQVEAAGCGVLPIDDMSLEQGFHFIDPDGVNIDVLVCQKVTPYEKGATVGVHGEGTRGAPYRKDAPIVHPQRLSHILIFTSDIERSIHFYENALGLRLSDYSKDAVAFLHAIHGADHHTIAFAQSTAKGFHHSSWDVGCVDEIGIGAKNMMDHGWTKGWGVGRHVLGSNYFYYVRDPWGSYCEYSYDIDFIPAGVKWEAGTHPPEDSLYLWGPDVPEDFVQNSEA
ncbi:VOC family protein [Acinetobacter baumannii]|uniref:VOC family protein n=1 Tax=Acinetobacter baumannii TaxID=470 RepID=UPI0038B5EBF8